MQVHGRERRLRDYGNQCCSDFESRGNGKPHVSLAEARLLPALQCRFTSIFRWF